MTSPGISESSSVETTGSEIENNSNRPLRKLREKELITFTFEKGIDSPKPHDHRPPTTSIRSRKGFEKQGVNTDAAESTSDDVNVTFGNGQPVESGVHAQRRRKTPLWVQMPNVVPISIRQTGIGSERMGRQARHLKPLRSKDTKASYRFPPPYTLVPNVSAPALGLDYRFLRDPPTAAPSPPFHTTCTWHLSPQAPAAASHIYAQSAWRTFNQPRLLYSCRLCMVAPITARIRRVCSRRSTCCLSRMRGSEWYAEGAPFRYPIKSDVYHFGPESSRSAAPTARVSEKRKTGGLPASFLLLDSWDPDDEQTSFYRTKDSAGWMEWSDRREGEDQTSPDGLPENRKKHEHGSLESSNAIHMHSPPHTLQHNTSSNTASQQTSPSLQRVPSINLSLLNLSSTEPNEPRRPPCEKQRTRSGDETQDPEPGEC
jgi:hypothetical protein